MNRPHFRRHPRPVDPEPYTRLDRLDGLPGRDYRHLSADELAAAAAWLEAHRAEALRTSGGLIATGGTVILDADDRIRPLTRYDAEWPDVRAAETPPKWADLFGIDPGFVGGDLAAMAAPLPGMARDDLGTYAEPAPSALTAEQIDAMREGDPRPPDRYGVSMCIGGDSFLCTLPMGHPGRQHVAAGRETVVAVWPSAPPRGRHRQTDPLDLILADLRDLGGL